MKLFLSREWILVGYHEISSLYVFANLKSYRKFHEIELECIPKAKYVDPVNERINFLDPGKPPRDIPSLDNIYQEEIAAILNLVS